MNDKTRLVVERKSEYCYVVRVFDNPGPGRPEGEEIERVVSHHRPIVKRWVADYRRMYAIPRHRVRWVATCRDYWTEDKGE